MSPAQPSAQPSTQPSAQPSAPPPGPVVVVMGVSGSALLQQQGQPGYRTGITGTTANYADVTDLELGAELVGAVAAPPGREVEVTVVR